MLRRGRHAARAAQGSASVALLAHSDAPAQPHPGSPVRLHPSHPVGLQNSEARSFQSGLLTALFKAPFGPSSLRIASLRNLETHSELPSQPSQPPVSSPPFQLPPSSDFLPRQPGELRPERPYDVAAVSAFPPNHELQEAMPLPVPPMSDASVSSEATSTMVLPADSNGRHASYTPHSKPTFLSNLQGPLRAPLKATATESSDRWYATKPLQLQTGPAPSIKGQDQPAQLDAGYRPLDSLAPPYQSQHLFSTEPFPASAWRELPASQVKGELETQQSGDRRVHETRADETSEPAAAVQSESWQGSFSVSGTPSCLSFYDVTVERYAEQPLRTLTLKQMMQYGEESLSDPSFMIRSARFVHREMPIRLAKRLMDLQFLPHIVVTNPHIMQVYEAHRKAFDKLCTFPPIKTQSDNDRFTALLTQLVDEHAPLLEVLAQGVKECYTRPLVGRELVLDSFLNNMLRSRISRRVIAEQHIGLQRTRKGYIGVICSELWVKQVVEKAASECTEVCFRTYGVAPRFEIEGNLETAFPYIAAHLDYVLFEIFKNACRAVVEHHTKRISRLGRRVTATDLPPIVVTICKGNREVTIKVSDQGGGIEEEDQALVWKYGYTTVDDVAGADVASPMSAISSGMWAGKSPMAGLGFGLPLSRVHAQYLGGDLQLVSIPGYGSDVYIRVHRLGDHAEEFEI